MEVVTNIIFFTILVLTIGYIIYSIYSGPGNTNVLSAMTPLNKKKAIVTADVVQKDLLGGSGSSVMGFFKLNSGDRTTKHAHEFTPLIYVDNNWYLEISPAPAGKSHSVARLRVKTNDGGTLKDEVIELSPIPKQKWIFIAILRDGRRFDVLYDNKIISSHRLENYPVVISSQLYVGNTGLDGSVIHVSTNSSRLSPNVVEKYRTAHVDTNNTVMEGNSIEMSFPSVKLFAQCLPGLPCDPVTKPPSNNLIQWSTPYA